jgi:hypothetical protein
MEEVHDLVYHGGGGFIYSDVWNMPVTTRRYHINKINEYLKKKAKAEKEAMNKSKQSSDMSKTKIPDFVSKIKK